MTEPVTVRRGGGFHRAGADAAGTGEPRPYAPEVSGRSEALDKLMEEGRWGVMAGKGFFDWGGHSPEDLVRERDRKLLELKQALRAIGPMEGS